MIKILFISVSVPSKTWQGMNLEVALRIEDDNHPLCYPCWGVLLTGTGNTAVIMFTIIKGLQSDE